jgi:hypothetical protein
MSAGSLAGKNEVGGKAPGLPRRVESLGYGKPAELVDTGATTEMLSETEDELAPCSTSISRYRRTASVVSS